MKRKNTGATTKERAREKETLRISRHEKFPQANGVVQEALFAIHSLGLVLAQVQIAETCKDLRIAATLPRVLKGVQSAYRA